MSSKLKWERIQTERSRHTVYALSLNVSSFTLLSFMVLASKAFPCLHTCCSKTYALAKTELNSSIFLEVFSDIAIWINLSFSAIPVVSYCSTFAAVCEIFVCPIDQKMHVFISIFSAACNIALCTQYIYLFTTKFSSCFHLQATEGG